MNHCAMGYQGKVSPHLFCLEQKLVYKCNFGYSGGAQRARFAEIGSQTCTFWTLVVLKVKSDFHTENKKVAWDLS